MMMMMTSKLTKEEEDRQKEKIESAFLQLSDDWHILFRIEKE